MLNGMPILIMSVSHAPLSQLPEPERLPSVGVKGKVLNNQAREIINKVYSYFQKSGNEQDETKLFKEIEAATGVGYSTVCQIVTNASPTSSATVDSDILPPQTKKSSVTTTPAKKRPKLSQVTELNCFDLGVMKRKIQDCYIRNELPTIHSLHSLFSEEMDFRDSLESLRHVIRKRLGLRYKKLNDQKILLERTDVITHRRQYLRMKKALEPDRPVIYLDETSINQDPSETNDLENGKDTSGSSVSKGKVILCHAGSDQGFVPNAMLLFNSKTKSTDHPEEMDGDVFLKWFTEQLLPNIPPSSVIVMDNTSYHCVRSEKLPTTRSTKSELQEWLTEHNIPWSFDMIKAELYELSKKYRPREMRFVIDEVAKTHGHRVLRLPPYHCDLNPIELICTDVKNNVTYLSQVHDLPDLIQLTKEALGSITPDDWKKACNHVKKVEDEFWEKDALVELVMESMIISLSESAESDVESSDEDANMDCGPLNDE